MASDIEGIVGSCLTHLSAAVSFFSSKHLTRLASVHGANLDSVFEENTDSFYDPYMLLCDSY